MRTSIPGFAPVDDGAPAAPATPTMQPSAVKAPATEIIGQVRPKALVDNNPVVAPVASGPTDAEISGEASDTLAQIAQDEAAVAARLLALAKHGG